MKAKACRRVSGAPASLRLRLLGIIGLSLVTLWSLVTIWMLVDVRKELHSVLDERLAASARMAAGLMSQVPAHGINPEANGPSPLEAIARDGLVCEVNLLRGQEVVQTMARTSGSPGLNDVPLGFSTRTISGQQWRSYAVQQGNLRIATADRLDVRDGLLKDVALAAGVPFAVALVGGLALLWFAIGQGLRPLELLRETLANRAATDTSPLLHTRVPLELNPLVQTIQHLLSRMQVALSRERRFTDDAAHELRTPLTAIKTHLQVMRLAASRADGAEIAQKALVDAEQGTLRLQQTLSQLLVLSRLDANTDEASCEFASAAVAASAAIEDAEAGPRGHGRIDLKMADDSLFAALPEPLLISALRNLLDNALYFSPAGSKVQLVVETTQADHVSFSVLDEGPGLNEEERMQAVQRFWRRVPASEGSGLGLSIVNEIATRFGGDLHLLPRQPCGLNVVLTLPSALARERVEAQI